MVFDLEGHLNISPKEVLAGAKTDRYEFINRVLIPGTPAVIPTHDKHHELLEYLASRLSVHPRNMIFRGSTKIGFSIAPRAEKLWRKYGPRSDLDLAIVDAHFFDRMDQEVGNWERLSNIRSRLYTDRSLSPAYLARCAHRGKYECYRHKDLPDIPAFKELCQQLATAPTDKCCDAPRRIDAFVFRSWWGLWRRYQFDMYCLISGKDSMKNPLPEPPDEPFEPEVPPAERLPTHGGLG